MLKQQKAEEERIKKELIDEKRYFLFKKFSFNLKLNYKTSQIKWTFIIRRKKLEKEAEQKAEADRRIFILSK